jgi:thiamine pyrophosphate-dependent acetolactate synthase large subunit-like protein
VTTTDTKVMDAAAALGAIARARGEAVVLTTMMVSRGWGAVSTRPELDLPLGGAMGKLSSVGLGIALAKPERKVIVLDGDGSLLMNLGTLVTIGGMAPKNLVHIVCQNSVYEVTGGQPIPGVERIDFSQMALGAGFRRAETIDDLAALERALPELLAAEGPVFVTVKVRPFSWGEGPRKPTAAAVKDLTEALRQG